MNTKNTPSQTQTNSEHSSKTCTTATSCTRTGKKNSKPPHLYPHTHPIQQSLTSTPHLPNILIPTKHRQHRQGRQALRGSRLLHPRIINNPPITRIPLNKFPHQVHALPAPHIHDFNTLGAQEILAAEEGLVLAEDHARDAVEEAGACAHAAGGEGGVHRCCLF